MANNRQKGKTSKEDLRLWEAFTRSGGIRPLDKRDMQPDQATPEQPAAKPRHKNLSRQTRSSRPPTNPVKPAITGTIEGREGQRLKRRKLRTLDLHGYTYDQARSALYGFLEKACHDGKDYVLVITGKGKNSETPGRGILREGLLQWVHQPDFQRYITAMSEAGQGHGGQGAFYLKIRPPR